MGSALAEALKIGEADTSVLTADGFESVADIFDPLGNVEVPEFREELEAIVAESQEPEAEEAPEVIEVAAHPAGSAVVDAAAPATPAPTTTAPSTAPPAAAKATASGSKKSTTYDQVREAIGLVGAPVAPSVAPTGLPTSAPTSPAPSAPATPSASTAPKATATPAPTAATKVEQLVAGIARPNGDLYYPRSLAGGTDVEVLRKLREAGRFPLLAGPPGTGKTALVEAAFSNGDPEEVITVNCHADLEVADFVGRYVAEPGGAFRWVDGPLPTAMREGRVLFLDDVSLAPPSVLARVYPLMDGRGRIVITEHDDEEVVAAPGCFVVGAWNPNVIGSRLSEALSSRFAVHMSVTTDLKMMEQLGVDTKVLAYTARLQKLRAADAISWAPDTRDLLDYVALRSVLSPTAALANLLGKIPAEDRATAEAEAKKEWPNSIAEALNGLSLGSVDGKIDTASVQ